MKKKSPPYAIIGAALLGLILVGAFLQYQKNQRAAAQAQIDAANAAAQAKIDEANKKAAPVVNGTPTNVRPVLYATQPVEAGVKLSSAFYEKKLTPNDILPDAYTADTDIVGWYATRRIEKGDPLSPRNIGKSLPYMSQRISPGMRAVTLRVFNAEPDNLTGGFAVDGDKVDLLYTTEVTVQGVMYKLNTQLIMQKVPILYIPGPTIKTDKTDGITPALSPGNGVGVTFEVTPEQAQALVYLSSLKDGHFSMILRAKSDDSQIKVKPFDGRDYDWENLKKVQKTVDKSIIRVNDLAKEIEAKEKAASATGTNETTTPTPPKP